MQITLRVNGREDRHEVEPRTLLVQFLRERLRLTGTHVGCETSLCGACTVLARVLTRRAALDAIARAKGSR
ncbi:MAG: 2Fe-2S iron-sulfur cluster binding domain-containing protein [bacterium]|nr:2Fe-2S iron-sulfur cluster binding domain-containing protein [bacterium]